MYQYVVLFFTHTHTHTMEQKKNISSNFHMQQLLDFWIFYRFFVFFFCFFVFFTISTIWVFLLPIGIKLEIIFYCVSIMRKTDIRVPRKKNNNETSLREK